MIFHRSTKSCQQRCGERRRRNFRKTIHNARMYAHRIDGPATKGEQKLSAKAVPLMERPKSTSHQRKLNHPKLHRVFSDAYAEF
jgi:hypothetical protein